MSERQAKKLRKAEEQAPVVKKKDKSKIVFNTISIILIALFLGLAAFAVVSELKPETPNETVTDIQEDAENTPADEVAEGEEAAPITEEGDVVEEPAE